MDGTLSAETHRWIQEVADRDYGGNWGAAAAAILEAAYAAAMAPADPWAGLDARMRHRARHGVR